MLAQATYQQELGAHGLTTEDNKNTLMRRWRYPSLSIHGTILLLFMMFKMNIDDSFILTI